MPLERAGLAIAIKRTTLADCGAASVGDLILA